MLTLAGAILLTAARPASAQVIVVGDGPPTRTTKELPKGTGLILGRTMDPGTGKPVPGALVTLSAVGSQTLPVSIMSDAMGRFVFRDLPKGSFSLRATKSGYVYSNYGKHLPDTGLDVSNDWQPLELGDNQHRDDVVIKMWKHASIGGTVRDERGEPVVGITVRALGATYSGGRRRYSMESSGTGASAVTDDRGMYRLRALVPGEFIVVVPIVSQSMPRSFGRAMASDGVTNLQMFRDSNYGSPAWTDMGLSPNLVEGSGDRFASTTSTLDRGSLVAGISSDGRVLQYEMQFHPNARSLSSATPIRLGSGEERSGIDFQLTPTPTVRVTGRVIGPSGPVADLVVNLIRGDTVAAMTGDPAVAQAVTDFDGSFMFIGITPGEYVASVLVTPQPQAPAFGPGTTVVSGGGTVVTSSAGDRLRALPTEPTLWARAPVVVGNEDVRDMTITLRRGGRVTGRVEFQGEKPGTLPSYLSSFYMERADGTQSKNLSLLLGRIDRQGNFASFGQPAGRYFVRVPFSTGLGDVYFAGAMYNGRDLSRTPIEIGETDIEGVVFVFRDRPGATITGSVRSQGATTDFTAAVVVFPADRSRWAETGTNPRDFRSAGVLGNGRYTVSDLPPGDYLVAAMPASRRDWRDPAVLEALSRGAERVTIVGDEQKSVDLTVPRQTGGDEEAPREHGPWVDENDEQQIQAPARDVRQPAPTGTGVVTGVVVTGNPQEPVRKAIVRLSSSTLGSRVTITDDNGRFTFASLPAGRFSLTADKAPYLSASYGATRQGRPGTQVTLAEGQKLEGLALRMERGAVIAGTIRDPLGEPISAVSMQLMRYTAASGNRRLSAYYPSTGSPFSWTTDDRGQYRFYGVEPGEYLVAAADRFSGGSAPVTTAADVQFAEQTIRGGGSAAAAAVGSAGTSASEVSKPFVTVPVFYPGTPDVTQARFITVAPGQEVHGLDFILRPAPAASIRGSVTPAGANVDVRLVQSNPVSGGPGFSSILSALPIRPNADGSFIFNGIAPGAYSVVATTAVAGGRGAPAPAAPQWALAEVQVAGADINNVVLSLQPAMTIRGRVVFDATSMTPPTMKDVRVSILTLPGATQVSVMPSQVVLNEDGTFSATGIMPGAFRVAASLPAAQSRGWIVRGAMLDNRDVMDTGFEVRPGEDVNGLTLTYTDRPAELSGVLTDAAARPASDYFIILFAADPQLWRVGARRIQYVRPGTDGRFQFSNLPAGKYLLAALTDVAPGEWLDPAFLKPLMTAAIEVTLAEGEKKAQSIQIK